MEILEARKRRRFTRRASEPLRDGLRASRAWPARSASGPASSAAAGWCSTRSPTPCTWCTAPSAARPTPGTSAAPSRSGPELHRMSFSTDLREKDVDLRRREEALRGAGRADRPLPAQGGLRLLHLHRRPDRRRRGRRLPARRSREAASPCCRSTARASGHQEGRLQGGLRRPGTARRHRAHRPASARAASISSAISTSPARPG